MELQRQQLLSERQQFQRDQLKAAEMRALQSPTLQPQTPLLFPPQKVTPTTMVQLSSVPPTTTVHTKLPEDNNNSNVTMESTNIDEIASIHPAASDKVDPPISLNITQDQETMETDKQQETLSIVAETDPVNGSNNEESNLDKSDEVETNEDNMEDTTNDGITQEAPAEVTTPVTNKQSSTIQPLPQEGEGRGLLEGEGRGLLESTESMETGTINEPTVHTE